MDRDSGIVNLIVNAKLDTSNIIYREKNVNKMDRG